MFEAISELSNETQRRRKGSTHSCPASRITRKVTADDGDGFLRLAGEARYRHFVRIPARIIRCLDYFQVSCDRDAAAGILRRYYLFIGVIDHAIDSGNSGTAALVFQHLARENLESHSELSDVALITEHLKHQIN